MVHGIDLIKEIPKRAMIYAYNNPIITTKEYQMD